jgi:hypothetical protein
VAIASLDDYIGAVKTNVIFSKTGSITTVANIPFSVITAAGQPAAGGSAANVTAGVVQTDATTGFPAITDFAGGATGYLSRVEFFSTVACRVTFYDSVWTGGAFNNAAGTNTISSPPSYAGRIPNSDYRGLELWVEQITAATGVPTVNVTYTNESGTGSRTTGAIGGSSGAIVGRMFQLPLQSGDSGVQSIQSVVTSVATVGTFNLRVLRPLWSGRIPVVNGGDVHDMLRTGLPQVFQDSALFPIIYTDSTASGLPDFTLEIASK